MCTPISKRNGTAKRLAAVAAGRGGVRGVSRAGVAAFSTDQMGWLHHPPCHTPDPAATLSPPAAVAAAARTPLAAPAGVRSFGRRRRQGQGRFCDPRHRRGGADLCRAAPGARRRCSYRRRAALARAAARRGSQCAAAAAPVSPEAAVHAPNHPQPFETGAVGGRSAPAQQGRPPRLPQLLPRAGCVTRRLGRASSVCPARGRSRSAHCLSCFHSRARISVAPLLTVEGHRRRPSHRSDA